MNQVKSPNKIQSFIFIYAGNEQAYQSYFLILIKCIYFYYLPACVYVNHVSAWFPQKTEWALFSWNIIARSGKEQWKINIWSRTIEISYPESLFVLTKKQNYRPWVMLPLYSFCILPDFVACHVTLFLPLILFLVIGQYILLTSWQWFNHFCISCQYVHVRVI